jgi:tetratricopeptide (TPR) repeat protein
VAQRRLRQVRIFPHARPRAVAALLAPAGCESSPTSLSPSEAYRRGAYQTAFREGKQLARRVQGARGHQAAYTAGLAAQRLGNLAAAERLLRRATRASTRSLRGEAYASLGLVYQKAGRPRQAAERFDSAAQNLDGNARGRALLHAAKEHQKLGNWPTARVRLIQARGAAETGALRARIAQQLQSTGFTIQLGAFRKRENARQAARRFLRRNPEADVGTPRLISALGRDGREIILVQIGRFTTQRAAARARRRVNLKDAVVVPLQEEE